MYTVVNWQDRYNCTDLDLVPHFNSWREVPKDCKTRRQWARQGRKVLPHQTPAAIMHWQDVLESRSQIQGSDNWEAQPCGIPMSAALYDRDQTTEHKRTLKTLAFQLYQEYFVRYASHKNYIWHNGHWMNCGGHLSDSLVRRHLRGQDTYGVLGGKRTKFVAIDLDRHAGDPDVFMAQLEVLLEEFHGRDGWHLQAATHDLNGVHLLRVLDDLEDLETQRWRLRNRLIALDDQNPELAERARAAGMKTIADLEIFPNKKAGFRLPLACGRTMLLDRPLELVWNNRFHGEEADVVAYMAWLVDPKRKYMSTEDILEYVRFRISKTPAKTKAKAKAQKGSGGLAKLGPMKGNYARFLIDFWTGANNPPDSLNQAILLLARVLPFYVNDPADAVDLIETYIDELPSHAFSDRLTNGDRQEVSRIVRNTVQKVYSGNAGQGDAERSTEKLKATVMAWKKRGLDPTNKNTWKRGSVVSQTKLAPSFGFTPYEVMLLTKLKDVLKCDLNTAARVAKKFIRFVKAHSGEISVVLVREFLRECGLRAGHAKKANDFLKLLCQWGWIYVRVRERPPFVRHDGSVQKGRARAYGLGQVMAEKFAEPSDVDAMSTATTFRVAPPLDLFIAFHPDTTTEPTTLPTALSSTFRNKGSPLLC